MGQHKNKPTLGTFTAFELRWIICVKKYYQKPKPITLSKEQIEEYQRTKEAPKVTLEYDMIPSWIPLGTLSAPDKRGNHHGVPFSFVSKKDALKELERIVSIKSDEISPDTVFALLEVRYVPNNTKVHRQFWFDKYVKTEVLMKLEDNSKLISTFKETV